MNRFSIVRRVLLAGLVAAGLMSTAFAQNATPSSGLAWPNVADVSASPNWHVGVFVLNGTKTAVAVPSAATTFNCQGGYNCGGGRVTY